MNRKKENELVLVFEKDLLYGFEGLLPDNYPEDLYIDGVTKDYNDYAWLRNVLTRSFFMPRGVVEKDPNYKQLIPYIVIQNGDKIFAYQREGAESRLTGKIAIGIGGHVNLEDRTGGPENAVEKAAKRELKEEIDYQFFLESTKLIIDYHLSSPSALMYAGMRGEHVDAVHFAVVYIIKVNNSDLENNVLLLDEGKQLDWMTKEELLEKEDQLELWSKMVLEECL